SSRPKWYSYSRAPLISRKSPERRSGGRRKAAAGENISYLSGALHRQLGLKPWHPSPLDVADEGLPDDLGEHQVATGLRFSGCEADEAKLSSRERRKGCRCCRHSWRPAGVGRGLALCHVDPPR